MYERRLPGSTLLSKVFTRVMPRSLDKQLIIVYSLLSIAVAFSSRSTVLTIPPKTARKLS
jgi:hypothetical protein